MADSGGSGGTSPLVVALVAVLSALIGAGATLGVAYFTFASKDQELKVHLVEIAIGILRADPKEDVTPARGWALDVIEKNSGVPFTQEDRQALLHKPLAAGKAVFWGDPEDMKVLSRKDVDDLMEAWKRGELMQGPKKQAPPEGK